MGAESRTIPHVSNNTGARETLRGIRDPLPDQVRKLLKRRLRMTTWRRLAEPRNGRGLVHAVEGKSGTEALEDPRHDFVYALDTAPIGLERFRKRG